MITILILSAIFPILWGFLQGLAIRNDKVHDQTIFHSMSIGVYIVFAMMAMRYLYINFDTETFWQATLVIVLNKIFWFDGIVNKTIGKRWLYVGYTAVFDKFLRCEYIDLIKGDKWYMRLIRIVATGINLLIAGVYMLLRIIGIVPAVLLTIMLIINQF